MSLFSIELMKSKYKEIHFESIDSTNTYLKHHYLSLDDLTIVSCDYQTNGKGRNDRVWKSDKGDNLLFSLLIKEGYLVAKGGYFSLVAAISVLEAIEKNFKKLNVTIKWPNDVYVNDKKVCGILLEGQIPEFLVVGIGININQEEFIGDYRVTPTSLYLETGKKIDINSFKRDVFDILIDNVTNIDLKHHHFIRQFHTHNHLDNKVIKFLFNGEYLEGKVKGISDDFSLIIDVNGEEKRITSGEVSLFKFE